MFGFGKARTGSAATFIIGKSALFSKKELSPFEFGRDIMRLGLKFGVAQFSQYDKTTDLEQADHTLLQEVRTNPGIVQLLYGDLIAGSFLCFAKAVLKAPPEVVEEIEGGILSELRALMPSMSDKVLEDHRDITANFAIAVEREITEVEADSSLKLLFQYITDFYPSLRISQAPAGLASFITGLGSRFLAICHSDWRISLRRN